MQRTKKRYRSERLRGSIYTGLPGVPKKFLTNKNTVNSHDHSATSSKRATWFECNRVKVTMPTGYIRYCE